MGRNMYVSKVLRFLVMEGVAGLIVGCAMAQAANPIITHKYTADPAAMVYKDTVYLYTGHDEAPEPRSGYQMKEWLCFSSTDMVNWTEHPVPLKVSDFAWAKADAWASQVICRNGKFYWYVAVEHATIPGKAIGVAVSDSPTGPFKDARGSALITNDMTRASSMKSQATPTPTTRPSSSTRAGGTSSTTMAASPPRAAASVDRSVSTTSTTIRMGR